MSKQIDNYVLLKQVNNYGEFGIIQKARCLINNEFVRIKVLKIERFINENYVRDMMLTEISVLKKF